MMMFKFHGLVETEGAVEVACSDLLAVLLIGMLKASLMPNAWDA